MEKIFVENGPGVTVEVHFAKLGGKLAIFHHGVPPKNPLLGPQILDVFKHHGYSVACPLRKGYVKSTMTPPAPIADDSRTSVAVLKALGYNDFLSVGFSAGGSRVLADLALIPEATAGITFGSTAPQGQGFDWMGTLSKEDQDFASMVLEHGLDLEAKFKEWAKGFSSLPVEDLHRGWMLDELAMLHEWGFQVASIRKPLVLFIGTSDTSVDNSCSRWIRDQVPGSLLTVLDGSDHDGTFNESALQQAFVSLGHS